MAKLIDCPKCCGTGKVRDNESIAAELVKLRKAKRLTMTEVAKRMGFSKGYISDLEHSRRTWTEDLEERYRTVVGKE